MPKIEEEMTAGPPAGVQSRRELLLAERRERTAAVAREIEAPRRAAPRPGHQIEHALSPLVPIGFHLLAGRGWPGSRHSRIDLIVVGPSGVYIVDASAHHDVTVRGGEVFRGEDTVTDDLAGLADLAYATESVLGEIGLAPGEIHPLVILSSRLETPMRVGTVELIGETDAARFILARGGRLTSEQVTRVLHVVEEFFPVARRGSHAAPPDTSETVPPEDDPFDTIPLLSNAAATRELERTLALPATEEWMSFPGPERARLIRRSFAGPARISGETGSGKTSLALQRAAYLARSGPGIVLVTSYVSTLPAVLSSVMRQLAPDVSSRVEFVGTHAFAKRLLSDRGIPLNLQPAIADAEFELVWRTVGRLGPLGRIPVKSTYWEDEIEHVIKGRGLTDFAEYAAVNRPGRQRALTGEQRQAVWDLYLAYQKRLQTRGAHDEADMVLLAEQSLRENPLRRYSNVVIDEAQDLSASMMRMLHLLVGDRPDGLLLVSDDRQSIYPGGYSLAEVGVSLDGRTAVLSGNHRNTREIAEFAGRVDEEGAGTETLEGFTQERSGQAPLIVRFTNRATHDAELPRRIREMLREPGIRAGDIAVIALTTFGVRAAVTALGKANIPLVELTNFDGRPIDAVRVGTVKRAKGLEFSRVLLVQVPATLLPEEATPTATATGDESTSDLAELQRRELAIAITRARDSVWIGAVP
jgi:hypothetical protein